jgi:hypothetical protein
VTAVARRETIPWGVMVLLGAMEDDEVPAWRTPYDEQVDRFEKHVKFVEQGCKMSEEMRLLPEQREAARKSRLESEARDFHNDVRRRLMKDQQRKEAEVLEAMQSQKLPITIVAEASRKWLLKRYGILAGNITAGTIIEQILFGMVQDGPFARRLALMLDLWKGWSQSGGMTKSHFFAVKEDHVAFSLASFVLLAIRSTINEPTGSVVGDLQQCLRMWNKVRLG